MIRAILASGVILGVLAACSPSGGGGHGGANIGGGAAPSGAVAGEGRGATLFENNCVACHQAGARGIPGVYPSLVGSPVVLGDPTAFVRWVVEGRRAASMAAGRYTTSMPKFGWMQAADAAALLTYLRSNFGNSAPPVDVAAVSKALEE
jgi:alcohol dehydrogenase (quinone), cytochrome c subunit